jgi:phosphoenolpyruvate carboxykinase (ATP)
MSTAGSLVSSATCDEIDHANLESSDTGWVGGKFGTGKRCPLKYTRKIIDSIHDGSLEKAEFTNFPVFNLQVPKSLEGVPDELLDPLQSWPSADACKTQMNSLAAMFNKAFERFEADVTAEVKAAGPKA